MNWSEKTILITGADGFIGSHLAERLVCLGAKTRALVNYNSWGSRGWLDHSEYSNQMEVLAGDINDKDFIKRAVEKTDIIFHLAALISIPYSYQAAESYVRTNIQGTLNLLTAAKDSEVERFIHTSSSEVYGTAQYVPIDEKHPLQAQSPYAATKIGADKLVEAFHLVFAIPTVIVRPFNTFGPRQSARAVIPSIITQCLMSQKISLGNLSPTRDFNYVEDTVQGFVLAASSSQAIGTTINLGSGREISIKDLVQLIAHLMNKKIDIELADERLRPEKSEVERLLADNSLARQLLGWQPQCSLEQGLERTIAWFQEHRGEYSAGTYEV